MFVRSSLGLNALEVWQYTLGTLCVATSLVYVLDARIDLESYFLSEQGVGTKSENNAGGSAHFGVMNTDDF